MANSRISAEISIKSEPPEVDESPQKHIQIEEIQIPISEDLKPHLNFLPEESDPLDITSIGTSSTLNPGAEIELSQDEPELKLFPKPAKNDILIEQIDLKPNNIPQKISTTLQFKSSKFRANSNRNSKKNWKDLKPDIRGLQQYKINHKSRIIHKNPNSHPYKCSICPLKFSTQTQRHFHQLWHEIGPKFIESFRAGICYFCSKESQRKTLKFDNLRAHIVSHHLKSMQINTNKSSESPELSTPSHLCPHCLKVFNSQASLATHLSKVHKMDSPDQTHPFKCSSCPQRFAKCHQLQLHQLSHEYGPGFTQSFTEGFCYFCNKDFNHIKKKNKRIDMLKVHILRHVGFFKRKKCSFPGCKTSVPLHVLKEHEELHKSGGLQCPHCVKVFKFKKTLDRHLESRHGPIQCEYPACPRTFPNQDAMSSHYAIHIEGEFKQLCPHCGELVKNAAHYYNHIASHQGFTCKTCGRRMTTLIAHNAHVARVHGSDGSTCRKICEYCGSIWYTRYDYRRHIRTVHGDQINTGKNQYREESINIGKNSEKEELNSCSDVKLFDGVSKMGKYSCKICFKSFKYSSSLSYHRRHTHDPPKFKCGFKNCGKTFAISCELESHKLIHDPLRVTCSFCGKFYAKSTIRLHISKFHKKEMDYQFKCHDCGDVFKLERFLLAHQKKCRPSNTQREESSELTQKTEEFICEVEGCGKKFRVKSYLKKHELTHDTQPVQCIYCGKPVRKASIRDHIYRFHKKDEGNTFKCEKCGLSFVVEGQLNSHMEKCTIQNIKVEQVEEDQVESNPIQEPNLIKKEPKLRKSRKKSDPKVKVPRNKNGKPKGPVFKCTLDGCGRCLRSMDLLQDHIERFHKTNTTSN